MKFRMLMLLMAGAFALGGWVAYHDRAPVIGMTPIDRASIAKEMAAASAESSSGAKKTTAPITDPKTDELYGELLSSLQEFGDFKIRVLLDQALRKAKTDNIEALFEKTKKLPEDWRNKLLQPLIERWVELDRAGAERFFRSAKGRRDAWLWAMADPQGALREATSDPDSLMRARGLLAGSVGRIAGPDGDAQARFLLTQVPPSLARNRRLADTLLVWIDQDPKAASAFLSTLPANCIEPDSLTKIASSLAAANPDLAFAFLERQPASSDRQRAVEETIIALTQTKPADALKRASDLISAIETGLLGSSFITHFSNALAVKDPQLAQSWVESLPAKMGQDPLIAVARTMAKTDPVAALEWARQNDVDVARSMFAVSDQGPIEKSGSVLKNAMAWHPHETVDWILSQPPGAEQDRLLERAFYDGCSADGQKGLSTESRETLTELFPKLPLESQSRAARAFASCLAKNNPEAAQEWVMQQEKGDIRNRALSGAMQSIAGGNRDQANQMIANLTDPTERDWALNGFVQGLGAKSPAQAVEQALDIRDTDIRFDALDRFVLDWLKKSPDAARLALEKANVPSQWRSQWEAEAKRGW